MLRLAVAVLVVALTGPSLVALTCAWTCQPHQATGDRASSACHEHETPSSAPRLGSGHVCHEGLDAALLAPPASPQLEFATAAPASPATAVDTQGRDVAHAATHSLAPPGFSRIPLPLRI